MSFPRGWDVAINVFNEMNLLDAIFEAPNEKPVVPEDYLPGVKALSRLSSVLCPPLRVRVGSLSAPQRRALTLAALLALTTHPAHTLKVGRALSSLLSLSFLFSFSFSFRSFFFVFFFFSFFFSFFFRSFFVLFFFCMIYNLILLFSCFFMEIAL